MSDALCVNGKFLLKNSIEGQWLLSEGSQFGFGLFETLLCQNGVPMDLEAHLERLRQSAKVLGLEIPPLFSQGKEAQLLEVLKPLLTDEGAVVLKLNLLKMGNACQWIASTRPQPYNLEHYQRGFKLGISPVVRHSKGLLTYHKSMNYGELLWCRDDGRKRGYDEVLLQNELGHYTEGTFSNVFALVEDKWYTPPLFDGLLPGIVRSKLIAYLKEEKLFGGEVSLDQKMIKNAKRLYLTNSLMGLMPVVSIGEKTLERLAREQEKIHFALGFTL